MERSVQNQRRFKRYDIAIPCEIKGKTSTTAMLTANVSRHGAFLCTDDPLPIRQLVKVSFNLPGDIGLDIMGTIARQILPSDNAPTGPGMGVDFFSLSANAKQNWDAFCEELERAENDPELKAQLNQETLNFDDEEIFGDEDFEDEPESDTPPVKPTPKKPEPPVRRKSPRFITSFLVRLKDKERMREFYTKDLSEGGMFLKTPLLKEEGSELEIVLIHPETEAEMPIGSRVVRTVAGPTMADKGMGIEFYQLSDDEKKKIEQFIETGVTYLDPPEDPVEEALENLEEAITMDDASADAHSEKGVILLYDKEEPEDASIEFLKALDSNPNCMSALQHLPMALALSGQQEKALTYLRLFRKLQLGQDSEQEKDAN